VDTHYAAEKLKKGHWEPCTLRVTCTAIERLGSSGEVRWRLRYTSLRNPGLILLDDEPPPRSNTTFKICGAGARGHRIFSSPSRDGIVKLMVSTALQALNLGIVTQVPLFCLAQVLCVVRVP
jgi:hypothetical protein